MSPPLGPTQYKGGWFDFDAAVPCWITFTLDKGAKITLGCACSSSKHKALL